MAYLQRGWSETLDFALILAQECLAGDLGDALVLVKGITRAPQSELTSIRKGS